MLVRASLKIACAARPNFINQQRTGLLARPKSAAIFQRDEGAAAKNVTTALRNCSGFWMTAGSKELIQIVLCAGFIEQPDNISLSMLLRSAHLLLTHCGMIRPPSLGSHQLPTMRPTRKSRCAPGAHPSDSLPRLRVVDRLTNGLLSPTEAGRRQ
jgi:hypothetical protein